MRKPSKRSIKAAAAAAIGVALFVIIIFLNGTEGLGLLLQMDFRLAALAILFQVAVTLVTTVRWRAITEAICGIGGMSFARYYASLLVTRAMGLIIPQTASDIGSKVFLLSRFGHIKAELAAVVVFMERLLDVAVLVIWVGIAAALVTLFHGIPSAGLVILSVVFATIILANLWLLLTPLGRLIASKQPTFSHNTVVESPATRSSRLMGFLTSTGRFTLVPAPSRFWLSFLSVVRLLLNGAMIYVIALAVSTTDVPFWYFVMASAAAQLSAVVAITPGGLGVLDAVLGVVLGHAGFSGQEIVAVIAGQRLIQYGFFFLGGGASYFWMFVFGPRERRAQEVI